MLTGDSGISNSSFWLPPPLQPKDFIFCSESQFIKMFSCPDFEVDYISDFTPISSISGYPHFLEVDDSGEW